MIGVSVKKRATKGQTRQDRIIAKVRAWQRSGSVHPLTCGTDGKHGLLKPYKDGASVVLRCPDYAYEHIPPIVFDDSFAQSTKAEFEDTVRRLLNVNRQRSARARMTLRRS
jgi:hypothetical protein